MLKKILSVLFLCSIAMAVVSTNETIRQEFSCNGSSTTYTFTIPCYSAAEVYVYKIVISTGAGSDTALTQDVDYTITSTDSSYLNGGVVTISPALADTYKVVIERRITNSQPTATASVTASTIEAALDKQERQIQDLWDRFERAVRLSGGDEDANLMMPAKRANKIPYFDDSNDLQLMEITDVGDVNIWANTIQQVTGTVNMSSGVAVVDSNSNVTINGGTINIVDTNGAVNIRDYGATGDGTTDDTTSIQAAINDSNNIYVPEGTYVTGALTLKAGTHIAGMGVKSVLKLKDSTNTYIFYATNKAGITIKDLMLNGNSTGNTTGGMGIRLQDSCVRSVIDNVTATDFYYDGVSLVGNSGYSSIRNCKIYDCKRYGISFSGVSNSEIVNNMTYSNDSHGIVVGDSSAGIRMQNNTSYSNGTLGDDTKGNGIMAVSSSDIQITGNSCYGSISLYGIQFNSIAGGSISNNECFGNFGVGIDDWNSPNVSINGNVVWNNTLQGIAIDTYSHYAVCSNNQVYRNGGCGVSVYKSGNVIVSSNQILNNNQGGHLWDANTPLSTHNPYGISGLWIHDDAGGESAYVYVIGNNLSDTQSPATQTYGLQIGSGPTNCAVALNKMIGNATASRSIAGGTISNKFGNAGYVTEAGGAAATIADGGTVTHGLITTPTYVVANPSVSGELVSVTAVGTTTFTVAIKKHDGSAGTTQTIYWYAKIN